MTTRFTRSNDDPSKDTELVSQAVARAKEGDQSALHFLYVRFADDVCGYVRSIVRDSHEAEDITQNVFAKLMTAIHRYEQREVLLCSLILRVARNVALDHIRARRQILFEEVRVDDDGHEQIGFERSQCLRDALRRLPAEQREVLVLRTSPGSRPARSPLGSARPRGRCTGCTTAAAARCRRRCASSRPRP